MLDRQFVFLFSTEHIVEIEQTGQAVGEIRWLDECGSTAANAEPVCP